MKVPLYLSKPRVSIVIVGTNELKWLPACLESISLSTYPNLQVIYVDNASVDTSADFVRDNFPMVKIIRNEYNEGYAGGNNRGGSITPLKINQIIFFC